jgi:pimeloyl-ACP methyl ester carboxylesterase
VTRDHTRTTRIALMVLRAAACALVLAGAAAAHSAAVEPARGEEVLTRALVVKISDDLGTRTGMSLDPVEAGIVRGDWKPPRSGQAVAFPGGVTRSWQTAEADPQGWFELDALEGGYAYFTVTSRTRRIALLEGMGHDMVFVNGEPRGGNQYQSKEEWEAWEPHFNYSLIPIELRRGRNELLFKCYRRRLKVKLHAPASIALLNPNDLTLPDFRVGEPVAAWGGIVVINASSAPLRGARLLLSLPGNSTEIATPVPVLSPLSIRKVGFRIEGQAPAAAGPVNALLALEANGARLGSVSLPLQSVQPGEPHRRTFLSHIDGSVQYYAVNPARATDRRGPLALLLSLHGASVEAINQAKSYEPKTWAHIVAPTNRRPYGYNWEDWGQLDVLEVLDLAKKELNIDPDRVYLTGHSMGGHGAWHIGETFPDLFAAIGPSAGWLSFWSYRARRAPDASTPVGAVLARAASPSDTFALAENLRHTAVYVLHGSDDDNVPVTESRRMVEHLQRFHEDLVYHEQSGAGHWWDVSDEPGTDCVDWAPMLDFFARHSRAGGTRVRQVDFVTASPGISSRSDWLAIEAQTQPLRLSSASVRVDPALRRFVGTTANVARLSLDVSTVDPGGPVNVELDGQKIRGISVGSSPRLRLARSAGAWVVGSSPSPASKNPLRYGTLKDAFRNHVVLVYGTKGTPAENAWAYAKARYDSERFWYQGNGSLELMRDVDFDPAADPDRNVVLYGNSRTNAAWPALLGGSPVQVDGEGVEIGGRRVTGADLACLFIRPRPGTSVASVGVIAGTGIAGMRLTNNKLYLEAGYPFPDLLLFSAPRQEKSDGILAAGFFGLDWSVGSDFAWGE